MIEDLKQYRRDYMKEYRRKSLQLLVRSKPIKDYFLSYCKMTGLSYTNVIETMIYEYSLTHPAMTQTDPDEDI